MSFLKSIGQSTQHIIGLDLFSDRSVPQEFLCRPPDVWQGCAETGQTIAHHGRTPTEHDAFTFLRDLKAHGGENARQAARASITDWIRRHGQRIDKSVCPSIIGDRITAWTLAYDCLLSSADDSFQALYFSSLTRQARFLVKTHSSLPYDLMALQALRGMIFAGFTLENREQWGVQGLDRLRKTLDKFVLSDGGVRTRRAQDNLETIRILIDIRMLLSTANYPVAPFIQLFLDRLSPALRVFRHTGGGLYTLNGTLENHDADRDDIARALQLSNTRSKALSHLPETGYQRITHGRAVLVIDSGTPPSYSYDSLNHAAPLSFEFSYGKDRFFVSCGTHPDDPEWREALRATAAHCSLSIDQRNACEIKSSGHIGRKPSNIVPIRDESHDCTLFEATHDGYVPVNGISHTRRLFLGEQGQDFRGEDYLRCPHGLSKSSLITVHFHLHPRVPVSLVQEDTEALLRLPGGSGWRFRQSGGKLSLENSVYLGESGIIRKTKQLIITARMLEGQESAQIKWAVQREGHLE